MPLSSSSSPAPIPYLLGKFPGHLSACTEISKPDYEVILHKSSTEDARAVLPTLLAGGEINGKTYPAIKLVVMGGGFSHDDFLSVYDYVPGAKGVPWLRPELMRPGSTAAPPSGGPPSAEVVAGRLRAALDEHRAEFGEEGEVKEKGLIWWF